MPPDLARVVAVVDAMNRAPSGSVLLDDLLAKRDQIKVRQRPSIRRPLVPPPPLSDRLAAVDKFCYNLSRKELLRIKQIICKSDEEFRKGREKLIRNYPVIADVQRIVADHFNITVIDLLGYRREPRFMRTRHIAMYLANKMTPLSIHEIGRSFRRDHTTILYAVSKIAALIETDKELAEKIVALKWEIGNADKK